MNNKFIYYLVVGLFAVSIVSNFLILKKLDTMSPVQLAGTTQNSAGTVFSSAKRYSITFAPATASATTTSIINTDATDRIVVDTVIYCGGIGTSLSPYIGGGLSVFNISVATSSAANPTATTSSSNLVSSNNIATSTADGFVASTTVATGSAYGRVWASGSYMSFIANATNTAVCNVGVDTLAL